jgi:ClpP class serine protease
MSSARSRPVFWALVVVALVFLLTGLGLGFYSSRAFIGPPKNLIGVIDVEGVIVSSVEAQRYLDLINQALINESIKAVVIKIDCPGGYADLVEAVYLDLLELKRAKPLVASIIFAASGGYYVAVAADYIYAVPTSFVGNVGVIGVAPGVLIPSEAVLETGAYKVTGFSELLFPFNLSRALDNFVSAVEEGRGGRLRCGRSELKRGLLYLGSEALSMGLVDELGSLQKAVKKAAEKAGLERYEVVNLSQAPASTYNLQGSANQTLTKIKGWQDLTLEVLNEAYPPPSIWYIYLSSKAFICTPQTQALYVREHGNFFGGAGKGLILVDRSHGNLVSTWGLDILIMELAKRNITVSFVSTWGELENMLNEASAIMVACPTIPYSAYEAEKLEEFVGMGRVLLLIFDPAYEYVAIPELSGPINSLATRFGLAFAKGYLYNDNDGEYFGFYRNVYVRSFSKNSLTKNLKSLVFFTATHVYSTDKGVAWVSDDTYSSTAEIADDYAVMALVKRNGTVIAIGDQTLLSEPYCYVEDNYRLILNIVSILADVEVP